jgi:hypothetical protein
VLGTFFALALVVAMGLGLALAWSIVRSERR